MVDRQDRVKGPRRLVLADEDVQRRLLDAVRSGVPLRYAADHAGVSPRTMFRVLRQGEDAYIAVSEAEESGTPVEEAEAALSHDDRVCLHFWNDVQTARAAVAVRNVALVQRSAQGGVLLEERTLPNGTVERKFSPPDWRASKFLLQTSFRGEFVDAASVEVTGAGGGPVQVEEAPSLVALASALRAARPAAVEAGDGDVVDGEVEDDD